jgi:hypothetical protein
MALHGMACLVTPSCATTAMHAPDRAAARGTADVWGVTRHSGRHQPHVPRLGGSVCVHHAVPGSLVCLAVRDPLVPPFLFALCHLCRERRGILGMVWAMWCIGVSRVDGLHAVLRRRFCILEHSLTRMCVCALTCIIKPSKRGREGGEDGSERGKQREGGREARE